MRPASPTAALAFPAALALLLAMPLGAEERPKVPIPPDHYTKVELNAFRATPSYEETLAFLRRLEMTSPYLSLSFYGTTGRGAADASPRRLEGQGVHAGGGREGGQARRSSS